ncbi:MAG TPA: ribosome maturation factor RimP [Acidimicrobiia bacterium]
MTERVDAVRAALEPTVAALGLELFDVTLTGQGRGRVLQVAIDRDGGVDLDAITAATEAVSALLDRDDELVSGPYSLEVTSPGVERPLRRPEHFRRAVGETVTVKTRDLGGSARRVRGVLAAADGTPEGGFTLDVDGHDERIDYAAAESARTVFEWGPAPKPGGPGANKDKNKQQNRKSGRANGATGRPDAGASERSRPRTAPDASSRRADAAEERQAR